MVDLNTPRFGQLLENSYNDKQKNIDGYLIDEKLSGKRAQVYTNDKGEATVVHRGTKGIQDVITDGRLFFGDKSNKRFQHGKRIQKEAEAKYGKDNVTTIGHSLGATIAEKVGNKTKNIITYNKPVVISDINKKISKNQTDIKQSLDPVSLLRGFQRGNEAVVLKSKTYNPFKEHSSTTARRIKQTFKV